MNLTNNLIIFYRFSIWLFYDTGTLAKRLGNTPEADGDGQLYKGRGLYNTLNNL